MWNNRRSNTVIPSWNVHGRCRCPTIIDALDPRNDLNLCVRNVFGILQRKLCLLDGTFVQPWLSSILGILQELQRSVRCGGAVDHQNDVLCDFYLIERKTKRLRFNLIDSLDVLVYDLIEHFRWRRTLYHRATIPFESVGSMQLVKTRRSVCNWFTILDVCIEPNPAIAKPTAQHMPTPAVKMNKVTAPSVMNKVRTKVSFTLENCSWYFWSIMWCEWCLCKFWLTTYLLDYLGSKRKQCRSVCRTTGSEHFRRHVHSIVTRHQRIECRR